jgi:hypothetical protein
MAPLGSANLVLSQDEGEREMRAHAGPGGELELGLKDWALAPAALAFAAWLGIALAKVF